MNRRARVSGSRDRGTTPLNQTTKPPRADRVETLYLALAPVVGRLTLAVLFAALSLFVFARLAHEISDPETRRFDAAVLGFFHAHQTPVLHTVMRDVSFLAGPQFQAGVFVVAVLGFALARRFFPDGLALLIAGVGGVGLIVGLKRLFHRPRPEEIFSNLGYSFPSGHSFFALVLYGMLAYWLARNAPPRRRRLLWAGAIFGILLVGFSRAFLGEHFPSDVLAGFAVGVPWLWGCLALPTAFHHRGRDVSPEEARARFERGRDLLKETALFLPNLAKLAARLARDPRVPRSRKVGLVLLAGYLALPFDLIPDFIPILGVADDIILATVTLGWVARAVPANVIHEHWDGAGDPFALLARARASLDSLRGRTSGAS